jgi:hypothetical protein
MLVTVIGVGVVAVEEVSVIGELWTGEGSILMGSILIGVGLFKRGELDWEIG